MQEKGQEPTLADVQDDAIKLLGFDPRELEGEFEEDKKSVYIFKHDERIWSCYCRVW